MASFRDITLNTAKYRTNSFVVTLLIVRNEILPVPFLFVRQDFGEVINFELLVLGRMRILKSPLAKWNVSTDKVDKPANLFMLVLNELK